MVLDTVHAVFIFRPEYGQHFPASENTAKYVNFDDYLWDFILNITACHGWFHMKVIHLRTSSL